MNKHNKTQNSKHKSPRAVSLGKLVYTVEVLLQLLEFLQHVDVGGGGADKTETRCQLLHQLAHRFVLATRRSTRTAQPPQDRGVDAVAVALEMTSTARPCLTRVHNVSTFIHCTTSLILLDAKVNNGTSYFRKGFYRKGIRKNQRNRRTKNKKIEKCQEKKSTRRVEHQLSDTY